MLFPNFKIFIDGGGNLSELQKKYLFEKFPLFNKVYVFEPNPIFYNSYKNRNLVFIPKAMWVKDCKLPLYLSNDVRQVGSSLLKEKMCRVNNKMVNDFHQNPIEAECLDFSKWLKTNMKPYYDITLKLDIEGAEYDVLWKMINDGTIRYIKKLYVEFHLEHLQNKKESHFDLINVLNKIGLSPIEWQ